MHIASIPEDAAGSRDTVCPGQPPLRPHALQAGAPVFVRENHSPAPGTVLRYMRIFKRDRHFHRPPELSGILALFRRRG